MLEKGTVLTNSYFSKDAIQRQYINVNPIVIYPPANVEKFREAALYSTIRENAILVLSRFSPDKEIENAIKVASIMKDKKIDAKMTLAGNISEENREYVKNLEEMIQDKRLADRVCIRVNVSFSHLLDLMKQSKVLLHPLAGEPFGIAIVEAMSAGLIPVVPNIGGNTEFVPSQYHFHTCEEAANIIKHALSLSAEDSERVRMSEIASKFSVKNYKENLKITINSMLASTTPTTPTFKVKI
jgi:glycosyltransferase involved in cell wall biosynthesis